MPTGFARTMEAAELQRLQHGGGGDREVVSPV
jgi:hypothetical protein